MVVVIGVGVLVVVMGVRLLMAVGMTRLSLGWTKPRFNPSPLFFVRSALAMFAGYGYCDRNLIIDTYMYVVKFDLSQSSGYVCSLFNRSEASSLLFK